MKLTMRLILGLGIFMTGATAFAKGETRNGWLMNETPANFSLIDKDGEWIIGVQGGYQADWATDIDFTANDNEFVRSNPPHGYACVSLQVEVNYKTKQVIKITGGKQLRLKDCLEDSALPYPAR